MENAHPIYRDVSWRGVTLTGPALLLLLVLVALGGWVLLHRPGGTRPVSDTGHGPSGQWAGALRPRYKTSVLVLNGNGIGGVAGARANRLLERGYREASATNAQVTTYARSVVLYRPGWENEAERLAKDARIGAVTPLDGRLPAGDSRFRLVLILGH